LKIAIVYLNVFELTILDASEQRKAKLRGSKTKRRVQVVTRLLASMIQRSGRGTLAEY